MLLILTISGMIDLWVRFQNIWNVINFEEYSNLRGPDHRVTYRHHSTRILVRWAICCEWRCARFFSSYESILSAVNIHSARTHFIVIKLNERLKSLQRQCHQLDHGRSDLKLPNIGFVIIFFFMNRIEFHEQMFPIPVQWMSGCLFTSGHG